MIIAIKVDVTTAFDCLPLLILLQMSSSLISLLLRKPAFIVPGIHQLNIPQNITPALSSIARHANRFHSTETIESSNDLVWKPKKRISRETMEKIRDLASSNPGLYNTKSLSTEFKISPEAVKRILKSKFRPSSEVAKRQESNRYQAMGERREKLKEIYGEPDPNERRERIEQSRQKEGASLVRKNAEFSRFGKDFAGSLSRFSQRKEGASLVRKDSESPRFSQRKEGASLVRKDSESPRFGQRKEGAFFGRKDSESPRFGQRKEGAFFGRKDSESSRFEKRSTDTLTDRSTRFGQRPVGNTDWSMDRQPKRTGY
ncbi:hypothetical protein CLU79DRAFT_97271 [Phycomyces nitens]|nr:hypothetical protein CLU79DRAFT_97271 [Phycomyces nitens]